MHIRRNATNASDTAATLRRPRRPRRPRRLAALVGAVVVGVRDGQPAGEHDHSTHSHEATDAGGGTQSGSMQASAGGHVMTASVEAPEGTSVGLEIEPDAVSGFNITVTTPGFTFTPEAVNSEHVPGQGHAHLYVDGVKITRLYGASYHLTGLAPGTHEVRVSLSTNSHADYVRGAGLVDATRTVTVPARDGAAHMHAEEGTVEPPDGMSVEVYAEADAHGGDAFNVRIDAAGFAFAPRSVNGDHVSGEGHAHIYVDGEKIGRVYGPWFFLGGLTAGEHEVRVTLSSNTHEPYARNGEPIAASTTVTVP